MGWQIRHQVMSVDDMLNSALNIEVQQHIGGITGCTYRVLVVWLFFIFLFFPSHTNQINLKL